MLDERVSEVKCSKGREHGGVRDDLYKCSRLKIAPEYRVAN